MARSDLLISLVHAGASGDKNSLVTTVEAIIAEERAKQHNVLAERLTRALHTNGGWAPIAAASNETVSRAREFIAEITPRRRLEELVLSKKCRQAVGQLIEEQHRLRLPRNPAAPRGRLSTA